LQKLNYCYLNVTRRQKEYDVQSIIQLLEELREDLEGIETVEAAHKIIDEYLDEAEELAYSSLEDTEDPYDNFDL
jgi:hypothetical protein